MQKWKSSKHSFKIISQEMNCHKRKKKSLIKLMDGILIAMLRLITTTLRRKKRSLKTHVCKECEVFLKALK